MHEIERYIACSKINLGLEVLHRRPDGYHELNTLFYRVVELHDSVSVCPSEFFQLTCSETSLPTDSRNLMMHAAQEFSRLTGQSLPPIAVHLEKTIPMGAGLGGGSSDAAVMLEILQDRVPDPPGFEYLMKLAAKIGADVPFFLSGERAAVASGIGEKLTPIAVDLPYSIVIIKDPQIAVPTRDAYAELRINEQAEHVRFEELFDETPSIEELARYLRNDFEPSVFAKYPKLAAYKHELLHHGAGVALMSGSGSSIFGLFESADTAHNAASAFSEEGLLAFVSERRGE